MMKAVQYVSYGGPEVLQFRELPLPIPKSGEVLVRVAAASVNSWDWDKLTGKPLIYRLMFGLFKPRDPILGCDIAGKIEAVGPGTSQFKVGDAVFGDISESFGGFAEYVCVAEKQLSLMPATIDYSSAAAIPHTAELAYQALFVSAKLKAGDQLLINGGGGGSGSFAVQFAKNAGAEVTVVDNERKKEAAFNWGADYFIDYHQQDFTKTDNQYDLIVDFIATRGPGKYAACLKKDGQLVVVGGEVSKLLQIGLLGQLFSKGRNIKLSILVHRPNQNLEIIKKWYDQGKFQVHIAQQYKLEQLPQAMTDLQLAQKAGKLVIICGEGV